MISILIPVFNYNLKPLIKALTAQAIKLDTQYEIIVCDDCSTEKKLQFDNKKYCCENNIIFLVNNHNKGRTLTRQVLAKNAQYKWLLFLDADVIPKSNCFLQSYYSEIKPKLDCLYGGICYDNKKPNNRFILRWKFGHKREDIPLNTRRKTPYKSIASGNLLIKKEVFLNINQLLDKNWYGYDNYFSTELKKHQNTIQHINNPVYHLGLESNEYFLQKKEAAARTIFLLHQEGFFENNHDNGLLNAFQKLQQTTLLPVFNLLFKWNKSWIKQNLLSKKPSLFLLNIYRLGYFCDLNAEKNA